MKTPRAHAGVTWYTTKQGQEVVIVKLDPVKAAEVNPVQVAALLVHEAVHIWQRHCEPIGSHNDHGDEEEAWAIQGLAQTLMYDYVRQTS